MIRATFDLHFAGEPAEIDQALERLTDLLSEAGHIFDDDFTTLHEGRALTGLRLRTAGAIRSALELLSYVDAYTIETNEELVDD